MKLRSLLLAATILAVPAAVMAAEPVNGVYVGLGAGFDYLNTVNGTNLVLPLPITGNPGNGVPVNSANLTSNGGWVALGSVGWGFGNGLRLEVEGDFRQNHVRVGNSVYVGGGANYQEGGVFVNGLYDFTTVAPWVSPYVGIGFGYVQNTLQSGRIYSTTLANQATVNFTNSAKGSAAGQLILGAAFPVGRARPGDHHRVPLHGRVRQPDLSGSDHARASGRRQHLRHQPEARRADQRDAS